MMTDPECLRHFAEKGDREAFAEVVRRQTDFVYSVAWRVSRNPQLAEDATQAVFVSLAQQAGKLCRYHTLAGWLHAAARNRAIDLIRQEARRRAREQEAVTMQNDSIPGPAEWAEISPVLDEAVAQLGEADRQAILLRFFNGLSHQEIGTVLGLSENSANKRIERALEKLRGYFARRGVTATSAMLAGVISANSVQAAPAGLATHATQMALITSATPGPGGSLHILRLISMNTKTKIILAGIIVAILGGAVAVCWTQLTEAPPRVDLGHNMGPAPASTSAKPAAQVAAPIADAVPAGTANGAVPPTASDPQADLNTAIPDLISLIQSDQLLTAIKRYMPPAYFEQMPQAVQDQLEQQEQNLLADPNMAEHRRDAVNALQSMIHMTPLLDQAGDRATYRLDSDTANPGHLPQEISFVKIDGKWYLVPGANALFF